MLFISSGHIESEEADLKKNSGWAYKSEGFETCIINNEIYMIFGVISSNGIQFKLENYVKEPCPLQNIERDLKSCSGFFCFVHISDSVRITTSLYCGIEIFYCKDKNNNICISSSFQLLTSLSKNKTLDIEYCKGFIYNRDGFNENTLYNEIKKTHSGTVYVFDNKRIVMRKAFYPKKTPDTLTEIVSDAVKTILNSYSDINLYLSGGLDSTYLFFIIKELKYNFTTYHIGPENDQNDSEIDDFRYLCNYYSINGQVLHTKRTEIIPLNNRSLLNNPRYVKLFNNKVTNSEVYINKIKSVQSVFFSGHGGDSVFVQNPSIKIIRDCFHKGKLTLAFKKAHEISTLKGKNIFETIFRSLTSTVSSVELVNWMDENKCDIPISHPWLESLDHKTARFDYFSELISLISGSQFTMADYSLVVYPYLFNSVIASQMSMKYEDTFDSHFDRIHVRQEGNDRFNCGYFYKKRKRSSSELIFKILMESNYYISTLFLDNKEFIEMMGVDVQRLLNSLEYNSSVSLQSDYECIIRIAKLVVFKNALEEKE